MGVRMAADTPPWGSRRRQGALAHLGHPVATSTVPTLRRRPHREPAPQRRTAGLRGAQCLQRPWAGLAATDFCTVDVATWRGLGT
jgi:hypothetical protein